MCALGTPRGRGSRAHPRSQNVFIPESCGMSFVLPQTSPQTLARLRKRLFSYVTGVKSFSIYQEPPSEGSLITFIVSSRSFIQFVRELSSLECIADLVELDDLAALQVLDLPPLQLRPLFGLKGRLQSSATLLRYIRIKTTRVRTSNKTAKILSKRVDGVLTFVDSCEDLLCRTAGKIKVLTEKTYDHGQTCLSKLSILSSVMEKKRLKMKSLAEKVVVTLDNYQQKANRMSHDMDVKKKKISKLRLKKLPYPNLPASVSSVEIDECVPHLAKLLQKEDLLSKLTCTLIGLSVSERAEITSAASYEASARKLVHILSCRDRSSFYHFCDVVRGLKGGDDLYQRLTGLKTKEKKNLATLFADARFAEKRIRKLELVYDEDGGDFIDSGGFSEVYKAVYKRKTVALKVFIKERRRNDEEEELLCKEAKVLLCIRPHRNVLPLVGICCETRFFALVLEYVGGENLHKRLIQDDHGQMRQWQNRCDVAQQIACGMSHLHKSQPTVIHLDLKPKNVLIKEVKEGVRVKLQCKICDFGLAKVRDVSSLTKRHSEDRTPSGTPSYIAPERYKLIPYGVDDSEKKLEIAKKSDVYSFGVILWQIREMERPFHETATVIHQHNKECPGLPKAVAEAPEWFEVMTNLCLNCHPSERPSFQSLSEDFFEIFLRSRPDNWAWTKL
ncbi:uncharacterized protein [Oscarella lobularis]|uniref:uncharacterized protein isoform X2 n=1 Tax=Oscarella lobularis TaxID=121494 RepID=UPI003313D5F9